MEVSITKMSRNGQVVIPIEVRREAGLKPFAKLFVFNKGGNIELRQVSEASIEQDIELIRRVQKSESQIRRGKLVKANTSMSDQEIDDLLLS